jgi:hypothetical protein
LDNQAFDPASGKHLFPCHFMQYTEIIPQLSGYGMTDALGDGCQDMMGFQGIGFTEPFTQCL